MEKFFEHFIVQEVGRYGYLAVLVLMTLESALIPIPSEVTMVFAGVLASQGRVSFVLVAILGAVANLLGSWLAYGVGVAGGRPLLERYGKFVLLKPHDIDRAEAWFRNHGEAAVFFGRLLPVVRTFISLPAGIAEMPFWRFSVYTLLGCLPWCFALTGAGYALGANYHTVFKYFRPVSIGVALLLVAGIVWWLVRRARTRRQETAVVEEERTGTTGPPPSA